jgi:acetylornithine deacetylase/succinyl-diaminopimelate desuccinylase-like protein
MSSEAIKFAQQNHQLFLTELKEFLKIPSISILDEYASDIDVAADWLIQKLTDMNLPMVKKISTERHPIVYAQNLSAGDNKPTILFYGHYDVQVPDPLSAWDSEPFTPTIRNNNLYARGASDNKGDISTFLAALESIQAVGELSINIKILLEGEEEIASPSLNTFIPENKKLLQADFCLNLDSGMSDYDLPSITYGLRGGIRLDMKLSGPAKSIHSGMFGGVIENPIHVLSRLIADMLDKNGLVTMPNFYDDVRPMSDDEKELSKLNPQDEAFFLKESGAPAIWGDENFSPYERTVLRPTFDVLMVQGGERKNAITATANAFISFRLVPDQDADKIFQQFEAYVQSKLPDTMTLELKMVSASPPSIQDFDTPQIETMKKALHETWGVSPIIERSGGGVSVVSLLQKHLGMPTVLTGITLPDDNLHGPNEKIHIPTWKKGIESVIRFITLLGNA